MLLLVEPVPGSASCRTAQDDVRVRWVAEIDSLTTTVESCRAMVVRRGRDRQRQIRTSLDTRHEAIDIRTWGRDAGLHGIEAKRIHITKRVAFNVGVYVRLSVRRECDESALMHDA